MYSSPIKSSSLHPSLAVFLLGSGSTTTSLGFSLLKQLDTRMSHFSLCELPKAFGAFTNVTFATLVWCFGGIPLTSHWTLWVFTNCECKRSLHVTFFLYQDHTGKWNKYLGSFVITAIYDWKNPYLSLNLRYIQTLLLKNTQYLRVKVGL